MIVAILGMLQVAGWVTTPGAVTVGDTVWLERQMAVPLGTHSRVQPLTGDQILEALSDPVVEYAGGTLFIRYAVAAFAPGRHAIALPPIELQYPDGRAVTVSGDTAWIVVRSVLPASDTPLRPKPSLAPLARRPRWRLPAFAVPAVVLVLVIGWGVARRRRRPRPRWPGFRSASMTPPVALWVAEGEPRAVAAAVTGQLRSHLADLIPTAGRDLSVEECLSVVRRERPEWPHRALGEILRSLERARFAPAVGEDVAALSDRVSALLAELSNGRAGDGSA